MKTRILYIAIIIFSITMSSYAIFDSGEETLRQKADRIHADVLTIDTHTDTPFMFFKKDYNIGEVHDSRKRGGKVDFPRMKQGGLDAVFFAVFVGQGPRDAEGNAKAKEKALKTFERIHQAIKQHPDLAGLALTPADAQRLEKEGKRAIFIGIENGYPIGKDLQMVEKYYNLGARYITLSHTANNDICDSSTDDKGPEHNGLSEFGKQVVKEMNRLGILVDISHVSDKSFYDVLEISAAPVFASHSNARAVCDNPRNLTDDMLKKIAQTGGVVQVCLLNEYVKTPPPNPKRDAVFKAFRQRNKNFNKLPPKEQEKVILEWYTLNEKYPQKLANVSDLVDHIDHIVKVAGIDHVGIGTDFDGGAGLKDCFDVLELRNITYELVKRGYTEAQIRKIWGGNFLRVFNAVIAKAEKKN